MGYTRYFKVIDTGLNSNKFIKYSELCKIISDKLCDKYNINLDDPQFTSGYICLNGIEGEDCETFYIAANSFGYDFCKTNRNPYDKIVCACLYLATLFFSNIEVKSDGDNNDIEVISFIKDYFREQKIDIILN